MQARIDALEAFVEDIRSMPHGIFGPWDDDLTAWDNVQAALDRLGSTSSDAGTARG